MRNRPKEATCQDCGAVYVKNSASQVRCTACSAVRKRQKLKEQQARYRSRWYSSETKEAKEKKQTRQSDAKEAAERLADHIRSADAAGLSYGVYMAKKIPHRRQPVQEQSIKSKKSTGILYHKEEEKSR